MRAACSASESHLASGGFPTQVFCVQCTRRLSTQCLTTAGWVDWRSIRLVDIWQQPASIRHGAYGTCRLESAFRNRRDPLVTRTDPVSCISGSAACNVSHDLAGPQRWTRKWSEVLTRRTQEGHSRSLYTVAFHPDGSLAASGGLDAIGAAYLLTSASHCTLCGPCMPCCARQAQPLRL